MTYLCRHEVRATGNWFTMTTFVVGEIISCVTYPIQMLVDIFIIDNNPACFIAMSMDILFGICFTLNVLALTVERYISICKPLRAPTMLTQRRIGTVILAIFIYAVFVAMFIPLATPIGFKGDISEVANGCRVSSVIPNRQYVSFVFANFLLPIPVMIIIYCRIYHVVRRHIRAVADLTVIQPQCESGDPSVAGAAAEKNRRMWKREVKSAVLLFVIVISFTICWLPFVVFILIRSFNSVVSPLAYGFIHAVVFSTVAINPIVYGFGNKTYRQAISSVFCGPLMKMFNLDSPVNVNI
ncbi:alpha-1A adrenergic receptor-like [Strongylocentrotus purpuratus]|uniref:G-protein coupled receptors family 1 profile domain-containing protein n=1 Tax=Strongylocentrotus purpuratus TaxID=7668 RepID=A0A7M7G0N1_STRPU|nr:alpha-1A adrenergic receptor-like [Strongylocentrotus purpuratus]